MENIFISNKNKNILKPKTVIYSPFTIICSPKQVKRDIGPTDKDSWRSFHLGHDLRYGCHFSDVNWDLGHFSIFIFTWFHTFSYVKFHKESKNSTKNANFSRETPVLEDFWCHLYFFWSWISCRMEIMYHNSLLYCSSEKFWRYWRKHCNIGKTGLVQDLTEIQLSAMKE